MKKKFRSIIFASWASKNKSYMPYQSWYRPLNNVFNRVISFDPQEVINQYGQKEMNIQFLDLIKKEQPEYIFLWLLSEEFYLETLLKIKELCPKTKTITYCGDDDTRFEDYTKYLMLFIDYFLITHEEFTPQYDQRSFLSLAVDTETFKPMKITKKYEVSFVGTSKVDRPDYIKYLKNNGVNIKIFGGGWESREDLSGIYGGKPTSEEYAKIANQTMINLCFTKNFEMKKHLNQHTFETGACNAFVLTEKSQEYYKYFKEGKDIIMFNNKENLLKKIVYYLKNKEERERLKKNLYNNIMKNFSKNKEFYHLFKSISKEKIKRIDKNVFISDPKVIYLNKKDLKLNISNLKEKLKNFEYVGFKDADSYFLKYKEQLQAYSINTSGKPISCCDYYVHSKPLGDYLYFLTKGAFNTLNNEDFLKLLNKSQLMVRKQFFIDNFGEFSNLFNKKKQNIMKNKNISFISFPLINIKKIKEIDYKNMKAVFLPKFLENLNYLIFQRKIETIFYLFHLIKQSLFKNTFILRIIFNKIFKKYNKLK